MSFVKWNLAELWLLDESQNKLRCIDIWHRNDELLADFAKISRQSTFVISEACLESLE